MASRVEDSIYLVFIWARIRYSVNRSRSATAVHQDPQYNVIYRNINMIRSFVDACESKACGGCRPQTGRRRSPW